MLKNTFFIPSYSQCIFYTVQSATKKRVVLNFKNDSAELVSPDGTKVPIVQKGRLYYFFKVASKEIWKKKIICMAKMTGHCNINDLKKLENVAKVSKLKIKMKLVVKHVS